MSKKYQITKRTFDFVELWLGNPKLSATEAYLRTHQTDNRKTASVEAARTLAKPSTALYLEQHVAMSKARIADIVANGSDANALRAAIYIQDRQYGRPNQRKEQHSESV